MIDLNLLRTFVFVAEARKLKRAAERLGLPKSTVSRHLAKLEDRSGAKLFERGNDGFALTPTGERLYARSHRAIHDLSLGGAGAALPKQSGLVRIQSPSTYGRGVLGPILASYLMQRPSCELEVMLSDRFSPPDLDIVDIGVFVGIPPGPQVELWPIGFVEAKFYASPRLFDGSEPPQQPSELKFWPMLTSDCSPGAAARLRIGPNSFALGHVRLATDDPDLLLEGALKGIGIARLPTFFAETAIGTGDLIPVLPNVSAERHSVMMARSRRNNNPAATDLAEFVSAKLSE